MVESPRSTGRFDLGGAVSATLGVGALVFGVVESATRGWASPVVVGSLVAGVLLLVALVRHESRVEQPILVLRLFASRTRCGAYLTRALYLAAMIGFFFFTTQFLQGVLGYSPLQAGFAFLPMTVVNFAVAMRVSRALRRFGNGPVLLAGVGVTFAGMLWLAQVSTGSAYLTAIALPMVLIGAGQGLAFAPLTSAGLAGARSEDAGAASGVINTAHQLGSSLGLAVLVTVSSAATGASARRLLAGQVSFALTAGAILLALALVAVAGLVLRPRPGRLRAALRSRAAVLGASR
jgi:predicted MFS family arabinose efflux permease